MTMEPQDVRLPTVSPIEPPMKLIAAGRLPVMAFVDAETERLLADGPMR